MDNSAELVLVDLSSIAYPIYLTTQADPDPNKASQQIVARVRDLVNSHPHAAICCDSGRSFRHDLTSGSERALQYKGNRPEKEAPLHHQITLACEALAADGFPVWSVKGFEADDLIAAATMRALALPDLTVLIVSSDKDLLQLVGPRVRAKSAKTGEVFDEAAVFAKFGVPPTQMRDFLTLVGDASDNIKGAYRIGEKTAASLLLRFQSIDNLYKQLEGSDQHGPPSLVSASEFKSLTEFRPRMEMTRTLVTLRTDVDIPFDEITADRVSKASAAFDVETDESSSVDAVTDAGSAPSLPRTDAAASVPNAGGSGQPPSVTVSTPVAAGQQLAVAGEVMPPVEWERELDPRSMRDARVLAKDMHESFMFSGYGSPQAILSTVMVGRELGLPAMASLRAIHNIEGKHGLSAALMVALILRSGLAEFFRPVTDDAGNIDADEQHATYETLRKGPGNKLVKLTYTIQEATTAGLVKPNSGWVKNPKPMLVARAQSTLARMVYPDLMAGLYTPEELEEIRKSEAA